MKKQNEKIKQLEREIVLPLLGLIIFSVLAYLNLFLIDWESVKAVFSSKEVSDTFLFQVSHLISIPVLIGEYILISLGIISIFALIKGGYGNLKKYSEKGLIYGLITMGLIFGLIYGLITMGLIFGLIGLITTRLIFRLITMGSIGALIGGLFAGLIVGLSGEFRQNENKTKT